MKTLKKRITSVALVIALVFSNAFVVGATEKQTEAVYDLQKGGTQTFVVESKDGELQQITIEEVVENARVAEGAYKITHKTSGWEAGFYVKISNTQITSVYSPFHVALRGSIKNASLVRNSSVKATYSFIYKVTIFSYDAGVIASISNSNLVVSQK